MYTLTEIHAQCVEDGDCLRWRGSLNRPAGVPKIHNRSGRRVVYEMVRGAIPADGLLTVICECSDCLNPAHLALTTRAAVSRKINKPPSMRLRKAAASARANRPKAKLTMETAREIRESTGKYVDVGLKHGVSPTFISRIKRGAAWRELGANPFQGLGAR